MNKEATQSAHCRGREGRREMLSVGKNLILRLTPSEKSGATSVFLVYRPFLPEAFVDFCSVLRGEREDRNRIACG